MLRSELRTARGFSYAVALASLIRALDSLFTTTKDYLNLENMVSYGPPIGPQQSCYMLMITILRSDFGLALLESAQGSVPKHCTGHRAHMGHVILLGRP